MPDTSLAKAQSKRIFEISNSTIMKVLLSILFVACLKILAPLLMTLFLSILVAVSLNPVPRWLMKRGFSKRLARFF